MVEYGYINNEGYMRSKMIEPFIEKYKDGNGEIKERVISVEEQAATLMADGWKPVDLIDESQMATEEGVGIEIIPFDAGDRISYIYEKVFDYRGIACKIKNLKKRLSEGDYKIIKCYEASLVKEMLPYDIELLRADRQSVRQEINQLEEILLNNQVSNI